MPHTAVGDIEIYWESHGEGEPLLLISGVSGGTWTWEESIGAWSPHFRVIVFDNMGAGRSSMPDRAYGIAEMADHAAAVLDAAEEVRAFVVGLSMGGMIAQELALCHPGRISGLVLGCTHCGGSERIPPAPEVIQGFAQWLGFLETLQRTAAKGSLAARLRSAETTGGDPQLRCLRPPRQSSNPDPYSHSGL